MRCLCLLFVCLLMHIAATSVVSAVPPPPPRKKRPRFSVDGKLEGNTRRSSLLQHTEREVDPNEEVKAPRFDDRINNLPSKFKVPGREVAADAAPGTFGAPVQLLLPDRLSVLNFNTQDYVADSDQRLQRKQRDEQSFWGRMYIEVENGDEDPTTFEAWSNPIQYLRAHFGGPPPLGRIRLFLADPVDLCDTHQPPPAKNSILPLSYHKAANDTAPFLPENPDKLPLFLITRRGGCTFGEKANLALKQIGAQGIIYINHPDAGIEHVPGPDFAPPDDEVFFASSINWSDGEKILRYLASLQRHLPKSGTPSAVARFVPIICVTESKIKSQNLCQPALKMERDYAEGTTGGGGYLALATAEANKVEFLQAVFGGPVSGSYPLMALPTNATTGEPVDLCNSATDLSARDSMPDYSGAAVVVKRGGCPFINKAMATQNSYNASSEEMFFAPGKAPALLIVSDFPSNGSDPTTGAPSSSILKRMGAEPHWKGLLVSDVSLLMVSASDGLFLEEAAKIGGGHQVLKVVGGGKVNGLEVSVNDYDKIEQALQLRGKKLGRGSQALYADFIKRGMGEGAGVMKALKGEAEKLGVHLIAGGSESSEGSSADEL